MPLGLYRRLMNLRCPTCGEVQPTFNLLATFKGGLKRLAVNDHAPCSACSARLRLVPRDGAPIAAVQISLVVLPILLFFTVVLPLFGWLFTAMGLWGLALLVVFFVAFPYLAAGVMGRVSPLYRKVIAL